MIMGGDESDVGVAITTVIPLSSPPARRRRRLAVVSLVTAASGTTPAAFANLSSQFFGTIGSTFGNNGNTSTNGRKMQFDVTVFF